MGGYSIKGKKYLVEAGDTINDAVNMWIDASGSVDGAWLEPGALSHFGQSAERSYSRIKDEALGRLHASQNSLIETREAMYQVAGVYTKAEEEAVHAKAMKAAESGEPRHRPEIDDPR